MKFRLLIFLLSFSRLVTGQDLNDIDKLNGVWVAEDFYNSFEKTKNIHKSKNDFYFNNPVALRINLKEVTDGELNIGYSTLHDHMLHPEVSKYKIVAKDTIREQGTFEINLKKNDSLNYYLTSEIHYFNFEWKSYLTWNDNTVILHRPKKGDWKSETIRYKQLTSQFDKDYQYPNPLYYYIRNRILVGSYTLKDFDGKVLSKSLKINPNGLVSGYMRFKNKYIYYSTDVYCGPPSSDEYIMLWDDVTKEDANNIGFVIKRSDSNTVMLYETHPRYEFESNKPLGNPKYILEKK